jgi:hypothetical protein
MHQARHSSLAVRTIAGPLADYLGEYLIGRDGSLRLALRRRWADVGTTESRRPPPRLSGSTPASKRPVKSAGPWPYAVE